jgi:hypothetical protein
MDNLRHDWKAICITKYPNTPKNLKYGFNMGTKKKKYPNPSHNKTAQVKNFKSSGNIRKNSATEVL